MRAVALLANPDSGSGEAHEVADCLRSHGLEVTEFALADAEAGRALETRRAGGGGRRRLARVRRGARGTRRNPARRDPDRNRERLRARARRFRSSSARRVASQPKAAESGAST